MAESNLSIDYVDVQYEIARFLGWDTTVANWTSLQNTAFSYILKRGLRNFYFPPTGEEDRPYYEWSFLKTIANTTLTASNSAYVLADDCSGTVLDFSVNYASGSNRRRLNKIPEADLRALQAMDSQTGYPKYYAVRNKVHAPTTGQRYELLVYPTPGSVQANAVITYEYIAIPGTIDNTNKYPLGGALYSEVIIQSIIAAAEMNMDDDPMGPQQQKFQQMLSVAMRDDTNKKANGRGGNT